MKNKVKFVILAIILTASIVLLSGCSQNNDNNSTNNTNNGAATQSDVEYTTYNTKDGVSFIYPSKWISIGTDDEPAFMGADGKGASVNYATDVIGQDESSIVKDFDTYIGFQKLYLVQQMTMLSDIDESTIEVNGRKTYILNYETEAEQDGKTIQLHVTQSAFEDDGNVKILTMAVLKDSYSSVQPIFEKMAQSFTK